MKTLLTLILVWLVILTGTTCWVIRAEREFLKFADFVVQDNLKNVVQSGGRTFYIVEMGKVPALRPDSHVDFWTPIYVDEKQLGKLVDFSRKQAIMVHEFNELDITARQIAAQADTYFKRKLTETQDREENEK